MEGNGTTEDLFKKFSEAVDKLEGVVNEKNNNFKDKYLSPILVSVLTGIFLIMVGSGLGYINKPIMNEREQVRIIRALNHRLELIEYNFKVLRKNCFNEGDPDLNEIKPIKDED